MISTAAWTSEIPTLSVFESAANCRLRNSGQCFRMIVSMSAFSIPSVFSCSMRQSGRSNAQTPGGSKERTSSRADSTSASVSGCSARTSSRETRR